MASFLALLVLSLSSHIALASPLSGDSPLALKASPTVFDPALFANLTAAHAHPDGTEVSAILLTCSSTNCAPNTCYSTTLPQAYDECLGVPPYYSIAVYQQYNEALDYGVYAIPPGCNTAYQVQAVNTCYSTPYEFTGFECT